MIIPDDHDDFNVTNNIKLYFIWIYPQAAEHLDDFRKTHRALQFENHLTIMYILAQGQQ